MIVFDGCCGLKGITSVFEGRGWQAVSLDINPRFEPTITADIREYHYEGPTPDLMWFSPPCTEFSREFMPWCKTGNPPDLSIVLACLRIINQTNPRYWIIENVKGAIPWFKPILGNYTYSFGPFFLWGYFPQIEKVNVNWKHKEKLSSSRQAERAKIPETLAIAIARAAETQTTIL